MVPRMITCVFDKFFVRVAGDNVFDLLNLNLSGDDKKVNSKMNSLLYDACKKLLDYGDYSDILQLSCLVFSYPEIYNKDCLLEVLRKLGVDKLCAIFYANYAYLLINQQEDNLVHFTDETVDINEYLSQPAPHFERPYSLTRLIPTFVSKLVYHVDMCVDNVTEDDFEKLVATVRSEAMTNHLRKLEEVTRANREIEDSEAEELRLGHESHYERIYVKTPTKSDFEKKSVGVLKDWMKALFLNSEQWGLAFKLVENYILVIVNEMLASGDYEVAGLVLDTVSDFLEGNMKPQYSSFLYRTVKDAINPMRSQSSVEDELFREYTCQTTTYLGIARNMADEYGRIGILLKDILLTHHKEIKQNMLDDRYDFLTFFTVVLLQSNDSSDLAEQYLVDMFDEISLGYRRTIMLQVLLMNCILNSDNFKNINILNGFFNYEMDRPNRDLTFLETIYSGMISFMLEAKAEIQAKNAYTEDSNRSWFDVLYGDGRIDAFVREQNEMIDNNLIEKVDGTELRRFVFAFSFNSGIYLGALGLKNEDGYDKLPGAISFQLQKRGQLFLSKYDDMLSFEQAIVLHNVNENVNIIVQRRLYHLLKEVAEDSLRRIQEIKRNASGKNEQETLELIDSIVQDLTEQIMLSARGRDYIERKLDDSQADFVRKYSLNLSQGVLLDRLPLECRNAISECLVTSQYVFDIISTRDFREEVDYSTAVIPLTKAIECFFHQVFEQLKKGGLTKEVDNVEEEYKKAFWFKDNDKDKMFLKKTLEFGSALYLIKKNKSLDIEDGSIKWKGKIKYDFYSKQNVRQYLKLAKLKSFAEMELPVLVNHHRLTAKFTNDDEHNRMVLYAALDYIRDEFRNKCAHKDLMSKERAEECRKILLDAQQLLWVLVWLYEPAN